MGPIFVGTQCAYFISHKMQHSHKIQDFCCESVSKFQASFNECEKVLQTDKTTNVIHIYVNCH